MSTPHKEAFTGAGLFEAFYAACKWLDERGYSYGSTCVDEPTGILKGDVLISKWRNLSKLERQQLDGWITGDIRNGPVIVTLKEAPAGFGKP